MSYSSEKILKQALDEASEAVAVGGVYAHYKDPTRTYEVMNLAISESDEVLQVVYRALYGQRLVFSRPLDSWCGDVEVDGSSVKRFTPV